MPRFVTQGDHSVMKWLVAFYSTWPSDRAVRWGRNLLLGFNVLKFQVKLLSFFYFTLTLSLARARSLIIHELTHELTHSLTHSLMNSLMNSLTHELTHSWIRSLMNSLMKFKTKMEPVAAKKPILLQHFCLESALANLKTCQNSQQ